MNSVIFILKCVDKRLLTIKAPFTKKEAFKLLAGILIIYAAGMLFITSVCLRIEAM